MANWTSPEFPYRDWNSAYSGDDQSHVSWAYQTTADILTLSWTHPATRCAYGGAAFPASHSDRLMSPDEAKATYVAMRNWVRVYLGRRELERLDAAEASCEEG